MTLARVSVLRGEGVGTGIPFIDDHIHTSEPVVDYLTEFSGIRGKLLPFCPLSRLELTLLFRFDNSRRSRSFLVKTYTRSSQSRLQETPNVGRLGLRIYRSWSQQRSSYHQCVSFLLFVRFRLANPFVQTDIYIPPSQIIDTVNIYHLASRQRKLSLRFLAYAVLHSAIQADTHDSIEDARTALQLYEEYNRLEAEGIWGDTLEEVYAQGKQTVRLPFLSSVDEFDADSFLSSRSQNFKVPTPEPPQARIEPPPFALGALGPLPNQPPMFMRNGGSNQSSRRGFMN
jgi:PAB-dependent poly(A)-specific ribonuclease subunit 2